MCSGGTVALRVLKMLGWWQGPVAVKLLVMAWGEYQEEGAETWL